MDKILIKTLYIGRNLNPPSIQIITIINNVKVNRKNLIFVKTPRCH